MKPGVDMKRILSIVLTLIILLSGFQTRQPINNLEIP